ncbi:MAG: hypothetical protein NZ703_11290 [Gemmataceae bacterium]|nr:hypothetical protein [Gemmataceae bacterium]
MVVAPYIEELSMNTHALFRALLAAPRPTHASPLLAGLMQEDESYDNSPVLYASYDDDDDDEDEDFDEEDEDYDDEDDEDYDDEDYDEDED